MGILANIFDKLGLGHSVAHPKADIRPLDPKRAPAANDTPTATAPKPAPISEVDVVAQLEKRAAANPQKLNWRTSIVDLLKLLGIDSSLSERKSLAAELGAPASEMHESASMNIWLHREVLKRIAANGGNVPASLLD
jgi:hypothetical protein